MNKKLLIISLAVSVVLIICLLAFNYYQTDNNTGNNTGNNSDNNQTKIGNGILIGFSIGTFQGERWQRDEIAFLKRADELGVVVDLQLSDNNVKQQISQIDGMILKGVDVLVIAPHDANSLTDVVARAHKAGIKVISYDRLIKNSNVDYYLSFDNVKVGEYQADYILNLFKDKFSKDKKLKFAYVGGATTDNNAILFRNGAFNKLQPKIDSGEIIMVFDQFTKNWDPANSYSNIKEFLAKPGNTIDAVVAANDSTAFGVIKALAEYKLDGKVPVSGQDAELVALQRIVSGTQSMTVYKPTANLASISVDVAIKAAKDEKIITNSTVNDGSRDIPSILLESVPVDKTNIDSTIVKDGYFTHADIYKAN